MTTKIDNTKFLLTLQPFVISVKGLKAGSSDFEWHADGEFFATFGNSEIQDADLDIEVHVENYDFQEYEVRCRIQGSVRVICDRCLEDLVLPVDVSFDSEELDLNQDIYDFVCTSLPMIKVHPEGECNADTLKYLNK